MFYLLVVSVQRLKMYYTYFNLFSWFYRTHSIAMGQILLDANYIESLTEKSEDFLDSPSLYKFCAISLNTNDDPDVITRMYTCLNLHCSKFMLNFFI